ncbi:MAG: Uma2 family endonuclease [Chloroflexi bacterium]|nr:Uma2 family endonuclease [Chloroflexota bacterium]
MVAQSQAMRLPLLENGDRLTRAEFERRYNAMSHIKKAELVEGVVYMPSPVSSIHAKAHAFVIGWLIAYSAATPGIVVMDNATVRLDTDNEVQPDALLRLERSGRSRVGVDGYIEGVQELIVEIATTSAALDLHAKKNIYRRNGVPEYIVWQTHEVRVDWFELRDEEYVALTPDDSGVIPSRVLPGLWLAVNALLQGDMAAVLSELHTGITSAEHDAFLLQT